MDSAEILIGYFTVDEFWSPCNSLSEVRCHVLPLISDTTHDDADAEELNYCKRTKLWMTY